MLYAEFNMPENGQQVCVGGGSVCKPALVFSLVQSERNGDFQRSIAKLSPIPAQLDGVSLKFLHTFEYILKYHKQ